MNQDIHSDSTILDLHDISSSTLIEKNKKYENVRTARHAKKKGGIFLNCK